MTTGTDIILGVARAADTVKQREAAARLERLSRTPLTETPSTAAAEPVSDWSTELRLASSNAPRAANASAPADTTESSPAKSDVYVQFEAVLLQNMVEAMMPKDSEAMFGSGTAGSMWKSMLAEKVAAEIARSGAVGIAKQVAAGSAARQAATAPHKAKVDDV
jgi:flagellar protein FlgJ